MAKKRIIQHFSKSLKISRLAKNRCYGHYCNLTRKYNYPRLTYYAFSPSDIMTIEYQFLHEKNENLKELIS